MFWSQSKTAPRPIIPVVPSSGNRKYQKESLAHHRTLNVRLFILSGLILAMIGSGAWLWHDQQVRQQAGSLLEAAAAAEEAEDWKGVQRHLRDYLRYHPESPDATRRLAQAADRSIATPSDRLRVVALLADAVRLNPDQIELMARLAELQYQTDSPSALATAECVIERCPKHAGALATRAHILDRRYEQRMDSVPINELLEAISQALRADPDNVALAVRQARLLRREARAIAQAENKPIADIYRRADGVLDQLIVDCPDLVDAHVARYAYRTEHGLRRPRPAEDTSVDSDLEAALRVDPNHRFARLSAAAELAGRDLYAPLAEGSSLPLNSNKRLAAIEHLSNVRQHHPREVRAYLGISLLEILNTESDKSLAEARFALTDGLKATGSDQPSLHLRLAEMAIEADQGDDAEDWLKRVEHTLRVQEAAADRTLLASTRKSRASLSYLQARWCLRFDGMRQTTRVVDLLNEAARLETETNFQARCHFLIGQTYARGAQWDMAAGAFRKATRLVPDWRAARWGYAGALRHCRRPTHAIRELNLLLENTKFSDRSPSRGDIWVDMAACRLVEQLARPQPLRDWTEFDQALETAKANVPSAVMLLFIEAHADLTKGGEGAKEAVFARINAAEAEHGKNRVYWTLAAEFYHPMGEADATQKALDKLAALDPADAVALQNRLRLGMSKVGSLSQREQEMQLIHARALWDEGRRDDSLEVLKTLAARSPESAPLQAEIALAAYLLGDSLTLTNARDHLLSVDGEKGTNLLCGQTLVWLDDARRGESGAIEQALESARRLVTLRSEWGTAHLIHGICLETQGQFDRAAQSYREALGLGDRSGNVLRRYLECAPLCGQQAEAAKLLDQLPAATIASREVVPGAVGIWLRTNNLKRAEGAAEQFAQEWPSLASAWALLGEARFQLASQNKNNELEAEAIRALETAIRLEPGNVSYRMAHAAALLKREDRDATAEVLAAVRAIIELNRLTHDEPSKSQLSLALGWGLRFAGDPVRSEKFLRASRQQVSGDAEREQLEGNWPELLWTSASLDEGPATFREGDLHSTPPAAVSLFGILLASSTDEQQRRLGAEWLFSSKRWLAVAAVVRGGPEHRDEALTLLRALSKPTRGDLLLTARLARMKGNHEAALADYGKALTALADRPNAPDVLLEIGRFANEQATQESSPVAQQALEQLQGHWGDRVETVLLSLQTESKSKSRSDLVGIAKKAFLRADPALTPNESIAIADEMVTLGMQTSAEELLRERFQGTIPGKVVLATWLARHANGWDAAVELAQQLDVEEHDIAAARVLAEILHRGSPTPEQSKWAEDLFAKAAAAPSTERLPFLTYLAVLREHQGNIDDAIQLTKAALELQPDNPAHRNNLAWFLSAYRGENEAALDILNPAIAETGPLSTMLDTKGLILMQLGRHRESVRTLEASTSETENEAYHALHLAESYARSGWPELGQRLMAKLPATVKAELPPRDDQAYEQLKGAHPIVGN